MPKSVTASLEALLKAEVATRIAAVKAATDETITAIRMAAGRCIAELEHLADRIASGEVEVEVERNASAPAAPVQPPATPAQAAQAAPAQAAPTSFRDGQTRSGWVATGGRLPY